MKTGLSVSKEAMAAFVDAVYAIAVTILALELPGSINNDMPLTKIGALLGHYAIAFSILFALWVQHRSINFHIDTSGPVALWLNAAILMLVCLIPQATSFVFQYGGNVTAGEIVQEAVNFNWTLSAVIDVGFITIVLASEIGLVALLHLMPREARATVAANIYRSKVTISILLAMVMAASLFLPFQNRYFLIALPVFLMLEHRISSLTLRLLKLSAP